ncbi:MAG TPA: hypothetical protein VIL01_10245 [Thermomicrobiales bacterium]
MVALPAIATLISLACALVIARDAMRRPRPHTIAWTIAFAIFAIAAGAEVVGSVSEWTPTVARVYYLTGAVLVVGYLAVGELYLLAANRISRFAPGATLLVTAVAISLVWSAPIDTARLKDDAWEAIERGPALTALTVTLNSLGTVVVVGGALYSAWRFKQRGVFRHRMIGCVLIAVGTLTVAAGGTLTRFGAHEYLYIAMAIGVAIIFAGYLETRRPDAPPATQPATQPAPAKETRPEPVTARPAPSMNGRDGASAPAADPAIAYLEQTLLPLDDDALSEACRVWSAPRPDVDGFSREEARRVWALRLKLSPEAQALFDAHSVPVRLQVTELYYDVFSVRGQELGVRG